MEELNMTKVNPNFESGVECRGVVSSDHLLQAEGKDGEEKEGVKVWSREAVSVSPVGTGVEDMYAEKYVPLTYTGTIESAVECHKHLWDFLARTGRPYKPFIQGIRHSCYACEYCKQDCEVCPIFGPTTYSGCSDMKYHSLYHQWTQCQDIEERKILAAAIRDLPWFDFQK